jgi:hypothetical protein
MPIRRTLLLLLAVVLAACRTASDDQRVRALIQALEEAAEQRNTADVLAHIAADYQDAQGLDRAQLRNFLRGYFLSHPKIELLVRVGTVEFETANRARVQVELALVGTQQSGGTALPTGDLETLRVELQRRDGAWLVVRADRMQR